MFIREDETVSAKFIADLEIDDLVMVGENEFSKVISFLHQVDGIDAEFIRLYFESPTEAGANFITLTPKHLISAQTSGDFEYIPAREVRIGDVLKHHDMIKGRLSYVRVDKVERVYLKGSGIYAPLTESGTLIVDNVHVSCFSMVKDHHLATNVYRGFNWLVGLTKLNSVCSSHELFTYFTELLYKFASVFGITSVFLNI